MFNTRELKKVACFLLLFIALYGACAQCDEQLIVNGGFEDLYQCPQHATGEYFELDHQLIGWYNPSMNTSDVFNACSPLDIVHNGGANVPDNVWGYQYAHSGDGYAGFGIVCGDNASEYLQTKLTQSILPMGKYEIEFYLSSGDTSAHIDGLYCTIRGVEFLFTHEKIFWPDATMMSGYTPQYSTGGVTINDSLGWIHFKDTIVLEDNYDYLNIGRWTPTSIGFDCDCFPGEFESAWSYVYIDDISLRRIDDGTLEFPNVFTPNNDGKNDLWYLPGFCGNVQIFNRWGQLLIQMDVGQKWDGTINNNLVMEGVYYFISTNYESNKKVEGHFQLLRE
jgi:gliding motility-associated-like protein